MLNKLEEMSDEKINELVKRIGPEHIVPKQCPALIIRKDINALLGREDGKIEYVCKITKEVLEDKCCLFNEETIADLFCLLYITSLPQIENYLGQMATQNVPLVETFINRKRYIDYSEYAKLRGKIKR